jgi:hypothetical protein
VKSFSDQLRSIIRRSGLSSYELGKRSSVDESAIRRFLAKQRGLTTDSLDRLTEELKLRLESDRKVEK